MTPTEIKEALRRETEILGHNVWAGVDYHQDGVERARCIIFRDASPQACEIIYFDTVAALEAFLMFEPGCYLPYKPYPKGNDIVDC